MLLLTGRSGQPGIRVIPIPYDAGSPATAGLWRVDVSAGSAPAPGQDEQAPGPLSYAYFVKLLRHPRLWPGLVHLPDQASRDEFVSYFPWRFELDMYEYGIGAVRPPGCGHLGCITVKRTDEDHLGLWWEFVPQRPASFGTWPITGRPRSCSAGLPHAAGKGPTSQPAPAADVQAGASLRIGIAHFHRAVVLRGVLPGTASRADLGPPPRQRGATPGKGFLHCRPTCWHSLTGCPRFSTCWTSCRRPTRTATQAPRTSCCPRGSPAQ